MKTAPGFNMPFSVLKAFTPKAKKPAQDKPDISVTKSKHKAISPEEPTFENAMKGVTRLKQDRIEPDPADAQKKLEALRASLTYEGEEVLKTLKGIVNGTLRFDIRQSGEYVEGHVLTLEPSVILSLKNGELSVQSHLDLHGFTSEAARESVSLFIHNAYSLGYRCILIVHGRGLKSPEGPVIKDNVISWLTTGALSRYVLAFSSARPCDGGTGAIYVLLKKRPERKKIKRTS